MLYEDFLEFKNARGAKRVQYPKRVGAPSERGALMVSHAFYKVKKEKLFFYILQNELGDLFKLSFNYTGEDVHSLVLQYFDTIPVAVSLCILKKGYLFAPAEKGDHPLYKF